MRACIYPVLFAVGGCAGSSTILTILPPEQEGGAVGGVAVIARDGAEEAMYDEVGQSVNTGSRSALKNLSDNKISDLLSILPMPPRPRYFTIVFGVDVSNIPPDSLGLLEEIRAEIAKRSSAEIEVVGYTDSVGDEGMNDIISRQRALAVVNELREYGFQVDAEDAVGRGERAAQERNGDEVADGSFRKVVVIVR